MPPTTALRGALNNGISSGQLADTKIILYSHRDSSGRVCRPRALYANSNVLKTVPYFSSKRHHFRKLGGIRLKYLKKTIGENETVDDYEYSSDSDLEDDEDEKTSSLKQPGKTKEVRRFDPFAIPGEENIRCEEHEERIEKENVVKIADMAFITFQAFLMYLYTGEIEFAPFGSEDNRRSRSAEIVNPSDNTVPRPSPKSIYRLADKYDIPTLKTLALNKIRCGLAKCDIVEESFSKFASRYDEVRAPYVEQLAFTWMEDSKTDIIRAGVDKKIDRFVKGDLAHATETLSALWEIANKEGDIEAPSSPTSTVTKTAPAPDRWAFVKMALIKSINRGVFFDRKYWARYSKAGEVLRPVYFSSTIMDDKSQQLNKLITYPKGGNNPTGGSEGDGDIESDCDVVLPGVNDDFPKDEKEGTRAVLSVGSFSAWKSLFFYRCTGIIFFAPLKSQGVGDRSNYLRLMSIQSASPRCSPKSIYVLAKLLELHPLRTSALADIKRKVSSDNVVEELLSWITASQQELMEFQCELLVSRFRGPSTIAHMKKNVAQISGGSSAHCAGALKLALKKAFEFKKKKRHGVTPGPEPGPV